ncbi:DUF2326 domain-containing protein [Clostridium gasigenes]|uniref:DUF2326 domain-containing protein n=1 Tax=Clostridium gasigenes TaxID=94869 RepID=UPI001C0B1C86|nr:DUF2326 domain-containing protein [Clostridium gasigenes]MBU3087157.1 DUF2326 domain-containing protein [Clostridium gasigenes]
MFLKTLKIESKTEVLREIKFHEGINLIVDETLAINEQKTGNNVGKTTVLKLIDFCLGADAKIIYSDTENKKDVYHLVKEYLINNEVLITLIITEDLNDKDSEEIIIERNFLSRKKIIRRINGVQLVGKDFEPRLLELIMKGNNIDKPSFRQIVSHNIRYKDEGINNTLKTLDKFTSDAEYETLYLYLLGCIFDKGATKQSILMKIKQEESFKERLEKKQTKNEYEIALSMIDDEIEELNNKKSNFNLNENFEADLNSLNSIKYKINKQSSILSNLKIRRELIEETNNEMVGDISKVDLKQLEMIYSQATHNIKGIQKTFEDLVEYHNNMISEKIKFITAELPVLNKKIENEVVVLNGLLKQEKELSLNISKGDSFEELEKLIVDLNEKYRCKGEYQSVISQVEEVENNILNLNKDLEPIDSELFSDDFENKLKLQLKKFNKHFASSSNELYGEKYALKHEKIVNKKKQKLYQFSAFNANLSSGKKQGEILCFDLACIIFSDEEKIPCIHFLLNDKKELMHGNQLIKVSEFIKDKNIQLVASILKDKLPEQLNKDENIVVKLSQESKLFKIEEHQE